MKSCATVMFHGRKPQLAGSGQLCGMGNVQTASPRFVSLDANAFFVHPSLSRHLTGNHAISSSLSRLRRVSPQMSKSFSAEVHLALSALCVFPVVSAMDADASSVKADIQQNCCSIATRPRDGVTSRISRLPGAPRGLGSHTQKNVAARNSIVCRSETHRCGTAVGHKN